MAFWEMVTVAVVGGLIHKARKAAREEREERERRINSWNGFNDDISENDFAEIVKNAKRGIKRLEYLSIDGPIVYGGVRSQSGLSEWYFKIDFNDYGHLTGTYWLSSDNSDSSIPEHVADIICSSIKNFSSTSKSYGFANSRSDSEEKREDEDGDYISPCNDVEAQEVSRQSFELKQKNFFRRHWKGTLLGTLILLAMIAITFIVWEYQKLIPVGYDSSEFIGVNFETVVADLEASGFTNVRVKSTEDLDISDIAGENQVYEVEVFGKTVFDSDTKYPYDIRIVIKYHALKLITPPLSNKEAKGMNYPDVISEFEDAGFINVHTEIEYDVVFGWFVKDGEVESVVIDGEKKFDTTTKIRPDAEIVITYHTYKSNKP